MTNPGSFANMDSREWALAGRMMVSAMAHGPLPVTPSYVFPLEGPDHYIIGVRVETVFREDGTVNAEAMLERLARALRPIMAEWERKP